MSNLSQDAFYQSLLNRRAGSGALFTDEAGRILVVEPLYKTTWEVPGGIVEKGEGPRTTCKRECLEELGLDVDPGRLLAIEHKTENPPQGNSIMFIYCCGTLLDASVIQLQEEELRSFRFVAAEDLGRLMNAGLAHRVRCAVRARHEGTTFEIVNGVVM
ncbi:MAG: NUDIX hydrolase [Chloroflexota bacterium]|jgi:8-oxo-dGTP pyrophosphatase MutT (NUDIX family)|nr:NUDIX hydrolase [Chloroflexota bacterium]